MENKGLNEFFEKTDFQVNTKSLITIFVDIFKGK
jgi:hypothetical protein